MKIARLGFLLGTLALTVAACGSGAGDTTTTTTIPVATTSTSSTTTTTTTILPPVVTTTTIAPPGATATTVVVQQDLAALGYFDGVVDGIAGEVTRAAIAKFQAEVGIEADGVFGSITDGELAPLLQKDEDYVSDLQETLIDLGFYGGPVDGGYGSGTRRGVQLVQQSCELEETGDLDIQTRLCLQERH